MAFWYPTTKQELSELIDKFFVNAEKKFENKTDIKNLVGKISGIVVPHAGYQYSGQIAADAYWILKKNLEKQKGKENINRKTAIIFGPSHYFYFRGILGYNKDFWQTPLGKIAVKKNFVEKTADIKQEHSIDNQIPFLQKIGIKKIMPICVGEITIEEAKETAKKLAETLKQSVVVFSTDLSHFFSQQIANKIDKQTIEVIENLKIEEVNKINACGIYPLMILLWFCKLGNLKLKLIEYKTSGDITGDFSRVVGYASFVILK